MKKSKLIALLNSIEGDPDVLLWNGLVGDWMDIGQLAEGDLVKMTLEYYLESCRLETCIDLKDWEYQLPAEEVKELTARHKKFPYEINQYVTLEDVKAKRYKIKRVQYIDAKLRGEKHTDRLGSIEY